MNLDEDQSVLTITVPKDLEIDYYKSFAEHESFHQNRLRLILIDFSKTKYVTVVGSIYLLYSVYVLVESSSEFCQCRLANISKRMVEYLSRFGFLGVLSTRCNLISEPEIDEIKKREISRNKILLKHQVGQLSHERLEYASVYWPMMQIPRKKDETPRDLGETYNRFSEVFQFITSAGWLNISDPSITIEEAYSKFVIAITEAIYNVWDHADTWGIGVIQSTLRTRTVVCISDLGEGFVNTYMMRNSIKTLSTVERKEVFKELLKEGESSLGQNRGHGIGDMMKAADIFGGILAIKTNEFLASYHSEKWKIRDVESSIGTQIMINF